MADARFPFHDLVSALRWLGMTSPAAEEGLIKARATLLDQR